MTECEYLDKDGFCTAPCIRCCYNQALKDARELARKRNPPHLRYHVSIAELLELKKVSE